MAGYYDDDYFYEDDLSEHEERLAWEDAQREDDSVPVFDDEPDETPLRRCACCNRKRPRSICHLVEHLEEDGSWFETVCEDCIDR